MIYMNWEFLVLLSISFVAFAGLVMVWLPSYLHGKSKVSGPELLQLVEMAKDDFMVKVIASIRANKDFISYRDYTYIKKLHFENRYEIAERTIDSLTGDKQMINVDTTLSIDLDNLSVDYDYEPACIGSRDGYGVPLEPDYPAHVVINSVWCTYEQKGVTGSIDILLLLSPDQVKLLEDECLEDANPEPEEA